MAAGKTDSSDGTETLGQYELVLKLYDSELARRPFFLEPKPIDPVLRPVRQNGSVQVVDASWPSGFTPYLEAVSERYLRYAENQVAASRLFLHREPKPVAVLVHGYLGGQYHVEQRAWPVQWLTRIGLDVALFVLPFHGVRGRVGKRVPPFPGSDPRVTNEGFRQAMLDLRNLIHWLLARGHREVGVMGMSLGGYTSALAATLEPQLAFAIPLIPLTSLADFARDQGRLGSQPEHQHAQHRALDAVHHVVSPLHRPPLIATERILIVGAEADRITPLSHAQRLQWHFKAPLHTWHGGHLLQFGRSEQFRRIGRMLGELGLTHPRG